MAIRDLIDRVELFEAKTGPKAKKASSEIEVETDVEIDIKLSMKELGMILRRKAVILKIPDANREKNKYTVTITYGGKAVAEE